MKLRLLLLPAIALMFASCVMKLELKPEVTIPVSDIVFFAEGGETSINISVRNATDLEIQAWTDSTFTEKCSWIEVRREVPKVIIKALPNEGEERSAVLRALATSEGGTAYACVPIVQAGKSYNPDNPDNPDTPGGEITIELSTYELEFPAEGGSAKVSCTTNAPNWYVDWTEEDMETEAAWIDFDEEGCDENSVRILVSPNTGEARTGYFFILASWEDLFDNPDADYEWDVIEIRQAAATTDPGDPVLPETEPQAGTWTKVTSTSELTTGYYLIACENKSIVFDGSLSAETIDSFQNWETVAISGDSIAATEAIASCAFWYDASNGSLRAHDGFYINWVKSDKNGLITSDVPVALTVTVSGGDADIRTASKHHLRYNPTQGQERFRFFKDASYTNQQAVQLFKMPAAEETPTFEVSTTVLTVGPKATEAGFSVEASDEVEWTASSSSSDFTLSKTAGAGPADIKISFEANPSAEPRSARITVSTVNESVETASWTVTITQGPASEGDIDDGTPGYDDHLIARRRYKRI